MEILTIQILRCLLCHTRRHRNPGPTQGSDSSSFDLGIGISHGHHYLSHSSLNYCRHTGWGSFEEVTTGFECDVQGRAIGAWPRFVERKNFCMRLPWTVMVSSTHDAAVLHYEGPDHGIRAGSALALRRKTKRQGHKREVR